MRSIATRRFLLGTPCWLAAWLAAGIARASAPHHPQTAVYPAESLYSLAMHMHGSMSEQSASWEWHTAHAESLGVDLIWWTDHDWRLSNDRAMKRYDFESAFWDSVSIRWTEPDSDFAGEFRYWEPDLSTLDFLHTSIADTLGFQSARSFRLEATGNPGSTFDVGTVTQTCSDFQNHHSLVKHVSLRIRIFPEELDPVDARLVFEVELSDHPDGTKILRYVLGSMEGEGPHSIPLSFTPGIWNDYLIDVTADAVAHFSTGGIDSLRVLDNTLAFVRLALECRNGSHAVAFFDEYRIEPDPVLIGNVLAGRAREMAAYYETLYPTVRNYVGSEISLFRAQPHLNAYAPNLQLVDYTGHVWSDSLYYAIDQVHAQGGAVSLNHLFGPHFIYDANPNETQQQHTARRDYVKRSYVNNRALGVDVLEVGYRLRGGCDLWEHLDLWDALNGNMVFLTGNGVTDSHGRGYFQLIGWGPAELGISTINNFVTWMWTEELSEVGFVRSMKSGRAFFGDPYRWEGALDLRTLDGFRMGQVVLTDADTHDLVVEVTNVPADVSVRLLQVEMREEPPVDYIHPVLLRDEVLAGAVSAGTFSDTVSVDTTAPSFLRIEVSDGLLREMVFSNPLYFVKAVPAAGVATERAALRLGEARLLRAESFRLEGASLSPVGPVLHLSGDEAPAGMGRLVIDAGALGTPGIVVGATTWSYADGVLELSGFSGSGSSIDVLWGGVEAPVAAPLPANLSLAPGRPNPFGAGTAIEYSLPREGLVRLEVLDTAGRRVSVLVREVQPAGGHRANWDGRDESGNAVAAGVYYIRLQHDREVIVKKAARLR
jgi:hypothetical protein